MPFRVPQGEGLDGEDEEEEEDEQEEEDDLSAFKTKVRGVRLWLGVRGWRARCPWYGPRLPSLVWGWRERSRIARLVRHEPSAIESPRRPAGENGEEVAPALSVPCRHTR